LKDLFCPPECGLVGVEERDMPGREQSEGVGDIQHSQNI
jgi:hypothetical protein